MERVPVPQIDWPAILPEVTLVVGALLILTLGALLRDRLRKTIYAGLTIAVVAVALVAAQRLWHDVGRGVRGGPAIAGAVVVDGFGIFFVVTICLAVVLAVLLSSDYLKREGLEGPEFYVLMLLSASGATLMATANDLIVVFLGLEVLSIALYVLAGYHRGRDRSLEAAVKYFVLGAFSSAFLLYGIALVYGSTGSTNLSLIAQFLGANALTGGVLLGGIVLILVGLGFKVAAVPFHMWTPDVYQGSPTPVTGFMAAAAKAAGFSALLRVFFSTFATARLDWQPIVWALAVLSLLVGSIVAVAQSDVKRMLAYSSISHAGYVLVGLEAASDRGIAGALFYLLAYTFMILGSFGVATLVSGKGDDRHNLDNYRGLSSRRPGLALAFTVFLLAQAGVPLTSGFLAKFYVISAAVERQSYALAIVAMLAAVIAAFFYLRVIVVMYMTGDAAAEGDEAGGGDSGVAVDGAVGVRAGPKVAIPVGAGAAIGLALAFTLVVGILPSAVIDFAREATLFRF